MNSHKKLFFLLFFLLFLSANAEEKNSVILYTTTTGTIAKPCKLSGFDGTLINNTYSNGVGKLTFRPNNGRNLTVIGDSGFVNCHTITSMVFPKGVTRIGYCCFAPAHSIFNVTLPNTVDSLADRAFHGAHLLNIELPEGIRTIPYFCFGFSLLNTITIPSTVTQLSTSAFECCYYLENIYLPKSIQVIGTYAFANCPSLHSIHFAGTIKQWNEIIKKKDWNKGGWHATPIEVIHCSDGDIKQTPWYSKDIEEKHKSFTIEITQSKWATLCLPICTSDIPSGIKVYYIERIDNTDSKNLVLIETDHIIAFKPYLLKGEPGNYDFSGQYYSIPESEKPYLGLLNGCLTEKKLNSDNYYVLQNQNNCVGFYRVSKDNPIIMPQYKAYLEYSDSKAKPSSFRIEEDNDTDNISDIFNTKSIKNIRSISGENKTSLSSGINIVTFEDGTTKKIIKL